MIEALGKSVKDVRDAIEHIVEIISKDEIKQGQSIMLDIRNECDRAIIGNYYVEFQEIVLSSNGYIK